MDEWTRFLNAYSHHKYGPSSAPADYCSIIIHGHEDKLKSAAVTTIYLDPKDFGSMGKWEALDRNWSGTRWRVRRVRRGSA